MREHDALWRPGRTGGIDEDRHLVCAVSLDPLGLRHPVQRGNANAMEWPNILHRRVVAPRVRGPFVRDFSREEHAPGAAVIPDLIELARRQPRVGNNRPGIEAACGQQETGERNRVLADQHHAIAGADAERAQRIHRAINRPIELAIGQASLVIDQRCPVGCGRNIRVHHLMDAVRQHIQDFGCSLLPTHQ